MIKPFRNSILILTIFLSSCVTLMTAKSKKFVVTDYQTISSIEDIEISYGNFQTTTKDDEFIELKDNIIKTHKIYGVICKIDQPNHMTQYILTERNFNKTRFVDYSISAALFGLGAFSVTKLKSDKKIWGPLILLMPLSALNAGGTILVKDKNINTITLNYKPRKLRDKLNEELNIIPGNLSMEAKQIKTLTYLNIMKFESNGSPFKIDSSNITDKLFFIPDSIVRQPLLNSNFIDDKEFLMNSENSTILNCKVLSWDKQLFWGGIGPISLNKFTIQWDLIDYFSKDILLTVTDTVSGDFIFDNEDFYATQLSNGIQKSLVKLMDNKELFLANSIENNTSTVYNDVILLSANEFIENKGEMLQSTVTLTRNEKHGSGFIISNDGYLLTSYNIVGNSETVEAILHDGTKKTAQVIRKNKKYNLALLKFDDNNLKPLKIFSDSLLNNDLVQKEIYTISTPADLSLNQSISRGMITAQRNFSGIDFLQINTSINQGSSGGPITLENGDVVGIINSRLVGENIESVGFGIPIWTILEVLNIQFIN